MPWDLLGACYPGTWEEPLPVPDCTVNYVTRDTTIAVPAIVAAAASSPIYAQNSVMDLLVMQISCVVVGTDPNYTLELFDGDPSLNHLLYQATGITENTFTDNAPWFQQAPASTSIYSRITNIDAIAMTATPKIRLLELNTSV